MGKLPDFTRLTADIFDEFLSKFHFYTRRDFEVKIAELAAMTPNDSARASVLADIYAMLDQYNIPYQINQTADYYAALVEENDWVIETLNEQILKLLYETYSQYPTPIDFLNRLVERFDGVSNEPLRLRILKRFVTHGDYLEKVGYGGRPSIIAYAREKNSSLKRNSPATDIAQYLDDGIFSLLQDADSEQLKVKGKLGLIKVADDLAAGRFKTGEATKRDLYMFAVVYGMTFDKDDPLTDVQKNLFEDYYTNNLMRFLLTDYQVNAGNYERLPVERGINFKNFAEVIMLYCLNQGNLSPQEKLQQFATMTTYAKEQQQSHPLTAPPQAVTRGVDLTPFALKPADFVDQYIVPNFDCKLQIGNRTIGKFEAQLEQRGAAEVHAELCKKLKKNSIEDLRHSLENLSDYMKSRNEILKLEVGTYDADGKYDSYGKYDADGYEYSACAEKFVNTIAKIKEKIGVTLPVLDALKALVTEKDKKKKLLVDGKVVEDIKNCRAELNFDYGLTNFFEFELDVPDFAEMDKLRNELGATPKEFHNFLLLIESANKFLKDQDIFDSKHVSRTSLLAIFYYYYNLSEKLKGIPNNLTVHRNFLDHCADFTYRANAELKDAHYRPLSTKSFFDVLVLLGSYAYLNGGMI